MKLKAMLLLIGLMVIVAVFPAWAEEEQETSTGETNNEMAVSGEWDLGEALDPETQVQDTTVVTTDQTAATQDSLTAPASESDMSSTTSISPEVQVLVQNGEWMKAREALLKLLAESADSSVKDQIEKELGAVNMKLLLSKENSPETLSYQVKSGDNLYNIAKKYKTSVRLIQKINELKKDMIFPGQKLKILKGNFSITVDKSNNILKLFLNEQFFKKYSVATGATTDLTPVGNFTIVNKLENPTWFHAGAKVPPGSPDNLLGTRWLGFSKPQYGIHGTIQPESIGQHATSGCVRMFNEEVEELYDLVPVGTKVNVVE